jgi:ABC-type spermidine/putrescine transport system permease subunit II
MSTTRIILLILLVLLIVPIVAWLLLSLAKNQKGGQQESNFSQVRV